MATGWPHDGPKTAPRWPQDGPKTAMLASRSPQESPPEAPGTLKMAPQRRHDATQEPPRAPEPLKWPLRAPNMAPKSPKNAFQERPEGPQERPKWPPRGLPEHFLHPLQPTGRPTTTPPWGLHAPKQGGSSRLDFVLKEFPKASLKKGLPKKGKSHWN